MEDSWVFIEDDDSSNYSLIDSDKIDSETEAELYSKIHYEENLSNFATSAEILFPTQISLDKKSSSKKRISSDVNGDNKKIEQNVRSPKKAKSDVSNSSSRVIIDSGDSKHLYLSDSFHSNLKCFENKEAKPSSHNYDNRNNTIALDSSDSDSNFWTEPNSTEKSDIKINLLNNIDTIYLSSSDSDNDLDASSPLMRRHLIFKNLSLPNIKTSENSKGLWHINSEDLNRARKYSQRYHENIYITCSNCNRKGHTFRTCPAPRIIKCFICGGDHIGARCSNRVCSNCYAPGHDRKKCWKKITTWLCHLCNMEGHTKGNCPDLWRRYHLTTEPFKIRKGKQIRQDTNIYCWNCGKSGHFGGVCPVKFSSRSTFSTWPCVISYDNPKSFLKNRLYNPGNFIRSETEKQNENLNISKRKDIHSKPELIATSLLCASTVEKGKKKRRKKKPGCQCNEVQQIVKQNNFPRTPKKKSPIKAEDEMPESVKLMLKKQLKLKQRQWRRNMNRKMRGDPPSNHLQKIVGENIFLNTSQEECSISKDNNMTKSVKVMLQKKFEKWKRNASRRLNRRMKDKQRNVQEKAYKIISTSTDL